MYWVLQLILGQRCECPLGFDTHQGCKCIVLDDFCDLPSRRLSLPFRAPWQGHVQGEAGVVPAGAQILGQSWWAWWAWADSAVQPCAAHFAVVARGCPPRAAAPGINVLLGGVRESCWLRFARAGLSRCSLHVQEDSFWGNVWRFFSVSLKIFFLVCFPMNTWVESRWSQSHLSVVSGMVSICPGLSR